MKEVKNHLNRIIKQLSWSALLMFAPLSSGLADTPANPKVSIQISPNTDRATILGSPQLFTGHVLVDMLFTPNEAAKHSAGVVAFSPGARSNWHSHPGGQHLVVTSGTGWVQEWGGEKKQIKAGDVIWTPPGVKHWHGATDKTAMTHYAIQTQVEGKTVNWLEAVTNTQYHTPTSSQ
ncbi:cupin domain-containing protein [Catenovulum sp. 2E275]|uniref:(R)-mandelonitrile lyase n=1 Tax=Catenovulum sp. 2E275 TaxID=2980497 RepID=UPI0021D1B360|nr:cupin domain-containing protein [Catenovulum sp. 2E275]MCU4674083.1 cupin domain-containing protein [Catenovulum sp. 2E275]